MKTPRNSSSQRGFTLMELMVAMAITTIIVTVLVSITSIAMDTWNRSRSELRAARQAKAMVDSMARDFEAVVVRRGNTNEWLSAISPATLPGAKMKSTNAAELIFFSAATDRYNGEIGVNNKQDKGGDVSCVAYRLTYKDPIKDKGLFTTFVLNRLLVNPDQTFKSLLGKPDLAAAFASFSGNLDNVENFVCENIFQFTVTFHVEGTRAGGSGPAMILHVPVSVGQAGAAQVSKSLKVKGTGIEAQVSGESMSADELKAGRITAVEIAVTVLSDFAVEQLRNRTFTEKQQSQFLAKNSYQYTKLVQTPSI